MTPPDACQRTTLQSPRLVLRAARAEDAKDLHAAFSDVEVMRYWSEPPHPSMGRTEEWLGAMVSSRQNGTTDFIICLRQPPMTPIGKIGVWTDCEIGFLLARYHWGKGLAYEALAAILRYLFDEKGFEYVTADTDPRNKASIALLTKVGFEQDGYKEKSMQIGGLWVDSQYLKLSKETWQAISSPTSG